MQESQTLRPLCILAAISYIHVRTVICILETEIRSEMEHVVSSQCEVTGLTIGNPGATILCSLSGLGVVLHTGNSRNLGQ